VKRVIYFFFTSILFFNCDNDLDINADWEEIPVIYSILNAGADNDCDGDGILNQDDDNNCKENYVRVQKSFIGTYPAQNMAQISDSIYYSQESSSVWIEEICGNDTTSFDLEFVDSFDKPDDGYFTSEGHYFYKFSEQLNDACEYRVNFLNESTGKTSHATTNVVTPIDISYWSTQQSATLETGSKGIFVIEIPEPGFFPVKQEIRVNPSENGKLYKMFLRFNYIEINQSSGQKDTLFIDWNFGSQVASETQVSGESYEKIIFDFNSIEFFQYISSSIPEKENVFRYAIVADGGLDGVVYPCLDFHFEILDVDLYNYFSSQNSSGLIQSRPIYTNVQNGVGLVSSISTQSFYGVKIDGNTNYDLATSDITNHLNFLCFDVNDLNILYDNNFNNSDEIINLGSNCQ